MTQTFPSFAAAMDAIPDSGLRAEVNALRDSPFEQTAGGLAKLRRDMAKLLHPDVSRCETAATALALFNAKLDNFASIVAKGYALDAKTNTWRKSAA